MRAIVLSEIGPPENLRLEERPQPAPTPGHAVVRVRAAGVCHRDAIDRRGGFPFMKRPITPGHELAGEVVSVGDGVTQVAPGDRVVNLLRAPCGSCAFCKIGEEPRCQGSAHMFGLTADGGYAEYALAPATGLVKLPAEIPFESACFLACTAGVALRGLRHRGGVVPGEKVLVTGASGGVGLHALEVARALGAHTLAVTTQASKVQALKERGAEEVVVSPDLAFHKEVQKRGGVDLVLDCVGTPTLNASLRSLKPMGRVVVLGNVTVERFEANPGLLILSELSLAGSSGCTKKDLLDVFALIEDGKLHPTIAEVLPLEAAAEAHRRLEAKGVVGRLVLRP